MGTSNLYAANPYKLGEVNFFYNNNEEQSLESEDQSFDWRDPIISNDGKVSYYSPPTPMLTLLEFPSKKNARAYLNWQKQKVDKIIKAQEIIEEVLKEGNRT